MVGDDPSINTKTIGTLTINKLLSNYKIGTLGEKKWAKKTHRLPMPSDLCPIYNIIFNSTMKLTQIELKHEAVMNQKRKCMRVSIPEPILFEPDYVRVAMLMKAA